MAVGSIYGQGGSSLIARLLGGGENADVSRVSSFCFWLSILTGAVIAIPVLVFRRPMPTLPGISPQAYTYAESYRQRASP